MRGNTAPYRKLSPSRSASTYVAVMMVIFAVGPVSAEQEEVRVFLVGMDDDLSPFLMRRGSEAFKEVVFPLIARTMARETRWARVGWIVSA